MSTRSRGTRLSGRTKHPRRGRSAAALTALFLGASLAVAVPGSASADAEDVTAARVDNPYVNGLVGPDWSSGWTASPPSRAPRPAAA